MSKWRNVSENDLRVCKCGRRAEYHYAIPGHWIECSWCGAHTARFPDETEPYDPKARDKAVAAWNRFERM